MNTQIKQTRSVDRVITSTRATEGAGFVISRPFPTHKLSHIDPFLLLDHMMPTELAPGEAKGAPDHPHRGFETVTYLLEGSMQHRDSAGNSGTLNPGDVQWMTAGSGVVHSEMPGLDLLNDGGRLHGFQLWVNLPTVDKMIKPRYQDIPASKIPVVENTDGTVQVKVIAGESMGQSAVIDTRTPILYLHFTLKPKSKIIQAVPRTYNTFAYVINGIGTFDGGVKAQDDQLVYFAKDAYNVVIANDGDNPLSVLLIGGVPLNEQIARYGPFVMNTKEEIMQAVEDYQFGRMGQI
jgi:redox-sensitive bicupin YhaK (pirin superfamily)